MQSQGGASSVLVLNRSSLSAVRYHEWLGADVGSVVLSDAVFSQRPELVARYRAFEEINGYVGNPAVELRACELHRTYQFDAVVALSERDILRAARLRQRWGLTGQHLESARAFRDKVQMKNLVGAADVPLARFIPIGSATDLVDAAEHLGYPMVVKPRRGVSAEGVVVLSDARTLRDYMVSDTTLRGDDPLNIMVEEYIEHDLYLVDGMVIAGELVWSWASWMSSNLGHRSGDPLMSWILEPGDPLLHQLRELARRALSALPVLEHSIIHMEVFRHPTRGLFFNEVASRIGGARIDRMLAESFGTGMIETYLRGVAGGPDGVALPSSRPGRITGFGMTRPRPGTLASLPTVCDLPGVISYEALAAEGTRLLAPTNAVSAITAVVVQGGSTAEVDLALRAALDYLNERSFIVE
jgi:hypothetical protein